MRYGALFVQVLLLLAAGAAAGSNAPAADAPAAGMIVSATADIVVSHGNTTQTAAEGIELVPGDRVLVPPGGRCSGFGPDGVPFALDGPAQVTFEATEPRGTIGDVASWVRRQLTDWLGQTRRRPLTTRGPREWPAETDMPRQLVPANGGAVRASASLFAWTGAVGVDRYVVTIAPEVGAEISHTARGNALELNDLVPGNEYLWKVSPDAADRVGGSKWRSFRVLTDDEVAQLEAAVASMSDLEAGVLLLATGLHEEALNRLDAAVSSGEGGPSALVWRARVFAQVSLYEEAYNDLVGARGTE